MFRNAAILGQHFAFAHGRAGVLQQYLLTQTDLDRLLGAHDRAEVRGILLDLPFTKLLDQSQRDPDLVINAFGAWVRAEVASMVPESKRAPFDILWLDGDAPLLAALLKERLHLTSSMSRRPQPSVTAHAPANWERLVLHDDPHALPDTWTAFVRDILATHTDDPAEVDGRVAAFVARQKLRLARESGSPLLVQSVRHEIDVQNIRTALRLKNGNAEENEEEAELLAGGTIDPLAFDGTTTIATLVRRQGFYGLADTLERPDHTGSDIERALSDIRADDIAALWNQPLQLEPVFAFAATALTQLSLLRALLIGKQSELSPQDIKRLLPPFLSASHYQS